MQSATHEETLVEAIGRCCGYVTDDPLRKQMANGRLRVRAGSSLRLIGNPSPTMRHPIGQVKRLRSTSRLLLPRTQIFDDDAAEELCVRVVHVLSSLPEKTTLKDETCGVFEELVTNAMQHGNPQGEPGASVCSTAIEYSTYRNRRLLTVGVHDDGIGLETLRKDDETADDYHLLLGATGFGTTGTTDIRGVGLYHTREIVRQYNGCMYIASKKAHIVISGDHYIAYESSYSLEGWIVTASLCA